MTAQEYREVAGRGLAHTSLWVTEQGAPARPIRQLGEAAAERSRLWLGVRRPDPPTLRSSSRERNAATPTDRGTNGIARMTRLVPTGPAGLPSGIAKEVTSRLTATRSQRS